MLQVINIRRLMCTLACVLSACASVWCQNDIIVSQYIHNQFAINPAFAGCREGITIFGSFRKQYAGIEETPQSLLLTSHTSLKRQQLTAGLSVWNQMIHQSTNTGITATVGYRFRVGRRSWVGLALQPGVALRSTDWRSIKTNEADDVVFMENTSATSPLLGFGATIYNHNMFAGFSVTSLFVSNDFEYSEAEFAPGDAQYVLTAGYLFQKDKWGVQPSLLFSTSPDMGANVNPTISVIYNKFAWLDVAYSTRDEVNVGVAIQAIPQLRVAYNYGMTIGDLSGYNSGTHEISVQFDLVNRVKTVGPRFY